MSLLANALSAAMLTTCPPRAEEPKEIKDEIALVGPNYGRPQNGVPYNESRIILGGHNITKYNNLVKGYKIPIPNESILAIYLHPTTPASIKEELIKKYGEKINVDKQQV